MTRCRRQWAGPRPLLAILLAAAAALSAGPGGAAAAKAPPLWAAQPRPSHGAEAFGDAPSYIRRLVKEGFEVRRYRPPASTGAAAAAAAAAPRPIKAAAVEAGLAAQPPPKGGARFGYQSAADDGAPLPGCSTFFDGVGSQPRSLAVILIKWRREYYPPREACCPNNPDPACDCTWGGYKYDELPGPRAYERIFSDECDGHTSINKAYHRMSGGRVTFTSNATAAAPPAARAAAPDPGRVDAFGWATLDRMRDNQTSICLDWCAEAMAALGVDGSSHQHYVCFPLYRPDQAPAPAVCDNACPEGGDCAASCPSQGPHSGLPGCGCGTCYWAWGGQWRCGSASRRRSHSTGFAAPLETWARGGAARMAEGHKVFLAHEIGHNLGLLHAGSVVCRADGGGVARDPAACKPDWYGDFTTFMGGGNSLTLPVFYKLQQGWVTQRQVRTTREAGTPVTVLLRDTNAPALQPPPPPGAPDASFLAARVPLNRSLPGGYMCPCPAAPPGGACAAGTCARDDQCAAGPCCTDPACADGGFDFYFVEFSAAPAPGNNDYGGAAGAGVAVRLAGPLHQCTSTRLVPTHVQPGGGARYLLTTPDPAGRAPGSLFEDPLRRVAVRLEALGADWARVVVTRW